MNTPYFAQFTDVNNRYGPQNVNQMADLDGSSVGPSDNGNTATPVGARINLALLYADDWIRGHLRSSRYSRMLPNLVDLATNLPPLILTDIAVKWAGWWLLTARGTRDFDEHGKPLTHLFADYQSAQETMLMIVKADAFILNVQGAQ